MSSWRSLVQLVFLIICVQVAAGGKDFAALAAAAAQSHPVPSSQAANAGRVVDHHGSHNDPIAAVVGFRVSNIPVAVFDCQEPDVARVTEKQEQWCCNHKGLMCHARNTTSTPYYDCMAELFNWKTGWSQGKKDWCCEHESRGCNGTASSSVAASMPQGTSVRIAVMKQLEEDRFTTSVPHQDPSEADDEQPGYDCDTGLLQGQAVGWSETKQSWCCEHRAQGCPASAASSPYDCHHDFLAWKRTWSDEKMWWCCKNSGLGCAPAPSPADFADSLLTRSVGQNLRTESQEGHITGSVSLRRLLQSPLSWEQQSWGTWAACGGCLLAIILVVSFLQADCPTRGCCQTDPTYLELPRSGFTE